MRERHVKLLFCVLCLALLVTLVTVVGSKPATPDTADPTNGQADLSPTEDPVPRAEKLVGICLPADTPEWAQAGQHVKIQLENAGYRTATACGDGTAQGQLDAIDRLLDQQVHCLILAPVDSALLPQDKEIAVPVLSYGSLLMDTDRVSGHICYDYYGMGAAIANQIESALALKDAAADGRSYSLELFMGASRDHNALLLYQGYRSVLDNYLDAGVLECKSGRLAFEDCAIAGWSAEVAQKACDARIENYYPDAQPDIVICASDAIAQGVIQSLDPADATAGVWPLITGNGATQEGLSNMDQGLQFLTVSTDPADPAKACVAMVDLVLFTRRPTVSLSYTFNHVVDVPTALCGFRIRGE